MTEEVNFATSLKKAINNSNTNVSELSKATGVTTAQINHFLSGRQIPKLDNLVKLCKALDVNSDQLLGLKPLKQLYRACSTCRGSGRVKILHKE